MPEHHAHSEPAFVRSFRNLTGLPSYHYDGVFGRMVHERFASTRPAVVALELPAAFRPALEWAATCWPMPVAALARGPKGMMSMVMPFVPGDSIFEAYRLAVRAGIEVALVDIDVSVVGESRPAPTLAVGSEFAARPGDRFYCAIEALNDRTTPLPSDLVREAAMAAALAALMAAHESVLWVGGFAHWSRIVERLRTGNFIAPAVGTAPRRRLARARLASSALIRLTGLYPAIVTAFAQAPREFEPFEAMRTLLSHAAIRGADVHEATSEPSAAINLARTGLYARNLAAIVRISEQPQLSELVLAASASIGPRYAVRLAELATADHRRPGTTLYPLTFEVDQRTTDAGLVEAGFCFRGKRLSAEPWFPVPWPILEPPALVQLTRETRAEYETLPGPHRKEAYDWHAYPPDQEAYEGFVRFILRRVSQLDVADTPSMPFVSGLEGGLDVRTTIRFWHEDRIYVSQHRPTPRQFRNGVIDWRNRTEDSDILRGGGPQGKGWNDPDSTTIGAVSRDVKSDTIMRQGKTRVLRRWREWSFVSLDHPTFKTGPASGPFWDRVIHPLVNLEEADDDLYHWLEPVFRFCEGKPFVYYSVYRPSARIYALARSHKVHLRWCPLSQLSAALLVRHGSWRQLRVSDSQWRYLQARLATGVRNGDEVGPRVQIAPDRAHPRIP